MEPGYNLRGNGTAPRYKTSVLQKLNFFDDPDTDTPLPNGAVLLIYLVAYIALFALVLLFRLLIKWNKTRVQACSDLCLGHINDCYWYLKKTLCCQWCYHCYCPMYFQGEHWMSKTMFRRTDERVVDSGDSCQTCCWPYDRLSCGCQRPSCHAIGCLCCVMQCRHPPPTTSHSETIDMV